MVRKSLITYVLWPARRVKMWQQNITIFTQIQCNITIYVLIFIKLNISSFLIQGDGRILNLLNLPNEVIEKNIFPYLRHKELIRIRLDKRLSDIANQVIEKRDRKYKLHCLQHEKHVPLNLEILPFDISDT